jgi:hypothetical protein
LIEPHNGVSHLSALIERDTTECSPFNGRGTATT